MLPLAHIGIGCQLVSRVKKLPLFALGLGTLLPDRVDKPLYYIPALLTGRHGSELGWIGGARSIGHTLLFFFALLAVARFPGGRQRRWLALALGVGTHLLLDNFAEPFTPFSPYASRIALLFPLYGFVFPYAQYRSLGEHLWMHLRPFDLGGEVVGALLIAWMWWKGRRSAGA